MTEFTLQYLYGFLSSNQFNVLISYSQALKDNKQFTG